MSDSRRALLLRDVSQFEVDFVIPRVGVDLPPGIDPFLLFKSRDPTLAPLHQVLLDTFNAGIEALRRRHVEEARRLFDFPEVAEIGLGNTQKSKRGAGVGTFLTELIIETLLDSPALMARGVKHIEEMQLVSVGIGPDRISDITANILKAYLIEYTQKQSVLWTLPLSSGVPVSHIFDSRTQEWADGYFDLPLSPVDHSPILLVPRRLVRALPWINYQGFFKHEFAAYLRPSKARGRLARPRNKKSASSSNEAAQELSELFEGDKISVTAIARSQVERVDRYVADREAATAEAQPALDYLEGSQTCLESEQLKARLEAIAAGREGATEYQTTVLAILNFLFNPELIDGRPEVRTIDGTERRDIIFTNDSDRSFWSYLRHEHSSIFLMFEAKNTNDLESAHL